MFSSLRFLTRSRVLTASAGLALLLVALPASTAAATAGPTLVFRDSFDRPAMAGWGAPALGPAYRTGSPGSAYFVRNHSGWVVNPTGASRRIDIPWGGFDVDMTFRVNANKVAKSGPFYVYAAAFAYDFDVDHYEYRAKLNFNTDGTVSVMATYYYGKEVPLGPPVVVPNVRQSSSGWIWVRTQMHMGNMFHLAPVIRVKAWQAGSRQPDWQWSEWVGPLVQEQDSGTVGLRTYVSRSATNGPVVFHFDSIRILTGFNWDSEAE